MPDAAIDSPTGPAVNATRDVSAQDVSVQDISVQDDGGQVTVSLSDTVDNATMTGVTLAEDNAAPGPGMQETTARKESPEIFGMDGSLLESSLLMGAYLFLILGVILLAFFLLRKFGPAGIARAKGGVQPRLKGRLMLGNKQSVAVVKVLDRVMILGVTERSITLLDKMGADDSRLMDQEEDEHAFTKFAEMLGKKRDEQDGG